MSDFAGDVLLPQPFISTYSRYSGLWDAKVARGTAITAGSSTWGTSNQARYVPITLPFSYLVNRVFWVNGSAVGGNADFGIYTLAGTRLYSTGSTVTSGASATQYVSPTPFLLDPGDYYFAFNHSATANAIYGQTNATALFQRLGGIQQEAVGATALPAVATFAAATVDNVGMYGITWTSSGF